LACTAWLAIACDDASAENPMIAVAAIALAAVARPSQPAFLIATPPVTSGRTFPVPALRETMSSRALAILSRRAASALLQKSLAPPARSAAIARKERRKSGRAEDLAWLRIYQEAGSQ
jgi:hypothetical protein